MSPYRRRDDDTRERTEQLALEIQELHGRITDDYWQHLPPELKDGIKQLSAVASTHDADGLRELHRTLEIHRNELSYAINRAPEIEAWLTALPSTIDESWLGEPWNDAAVVVHPANEWARSRSAELAARLARWVVALDSSAKILQLGEDARIACFSAHGAPFALEARLAISNDLEITLVTPLARGVAPMTLEEKSWSHAVTTTFGLQTDTKTGDRAFDERYFVSASERSAQLLLGPAARAQLMDLARFATPRVTIEQRAARISWEYMLVRDMLDVALTVLSTLRHTRLDVTLVR